MSSRPPPITERTARSSAVGRLYNSNLRPMIIVLALFSGIWTLVWAVDLFRDINFDKDHGQPKLATFAIVLGSLYITNTAIEAFGITAASLQNLQLVRIYSFANAFSSLLIVVAGFIHVSTGSDLVFRFGIWGPTVRDHLDADEAEQFCKNAWLAAMGPVPTIPWPRSLIPTVLPTPLHELQQRRVRKHLRTSLRREWETASVCG
ncbi:hypothetical protein K474DRAFT_71437 [Panus rudis PR-1116 ss-1]|nr:hypothetical protein K474DRAFT_71437 [Panus rudis PR-1116 ss-1]